MSYIVFGAVFGLIISSLRRDFHVKEILGYTILAAVGGLYGNFIMSVFEESMGLENTLLRALLITLGGISLCSIKALLNNRKDTHQGHLAS
jgi:H+/Cl- antiporter ClcA